MWLFPLKELRIVFKKDDYCFFFKMSISAAKSSWNFAVLCRRTIRLTLSLQCENTRHFNFRVSQSEFWFNAQTHENKTEHAVQIKEEKKNITKNERS